MAVIRQKTTVFNKPVGVVRTDVGARSVGDAIGNAASGIQRIAFQQASQAAQTKGEDFAKSIRLRSFRTIDPKTGNTVNFNAPPEPPSGFGSIAANAYQRVVDQRYENSINQEIKFKAKEISLKYPLDTDSYSEVMQDYIAKMSEGSIGKYKAYVEEKGAEWLADTQSNIQANVATRERQNASNSIDQGLILLKENIFEQAALGSPNGVIDELLEKARTVSQDGEDSGLKLQGFVDSSFRAASLQAAKGSIQFLLGYADDDTERRKIKLAISSSGTNMAGLTSFQKKEIKRIVKLSGADVASAYSYAVTASQPFDAVQNDEDALALEKARTNYERYRLDFDGIEIDAQLFSSDSLSSLSASEIRASTKLIAEEVQSRIAQVKEAALQDTDNIYTAAQASADIFSIKTKALYTPLLNAASLGNPEALAIVLNGGQDADESYDLLTQSQKQFVNALKKEGLIAKNGSSEFKQFINSTIGGGVNNVLERKNKVEIENSLNEDLALFFQHANSGGDTENTTGNQSSDYMIGLIDKALKEEAISPDQARVNRVRVRTESASSYIVNFSEGSNSQELGDLEVYIDTSGKKKVGADGVKFNEEVIRTGDQILSVLTSRAEIDTAISKVSGIRSRVAADETAIQSQINARADKVLQYKRLNSGNLDPKSKKDREFLDVAIAEQFPEILNGRTMGQLFNDPEVFNSEDGRNLLTFISQQSTMPQSLAQALTNLAGGQFKGNSPKALLSHFANFAEYEHQGVTMNSLMMESLDSEEYSTLKYLLDAGRTGLIDVNNEGSLAEVFALRNTYKNNDNFKKRIETRLDSTLDEFVLTLDNITDMPLSAVNGLKALTLNIMSLPLNQDKSSGEIRGILEEQMLMKYPSGGGIVFGNGGSENTSAPLSYASGAGNEDLLKAHIIKQVTLSDPLGGNVVLGLTKSTSVLADSNKLSISPALLGPVQSVLGAVFGDDSQMGNVFLKPIGLRTGNNIQYAVFRVAPMSEGGYRQVYTMVDNKVGPPSERKSYRAPLIISNTDSEFTTAVNNRNNIRNHRIQSAALDAFGGPRSLPTSALRHGPMTTSGGLFSPANPEATQNIMLEF